MLASKLKACQETSNPKGTGAPESTKIGSPFHQASVPCRIDNAPNGNDCITHKTVATNSVPKANPPSNITPVRLPPRARRFCHRTMTHQDEANTRNNLSRKKTLVEKSHGRSMVPKQLEFSPYKLTCVTCCQKIIEPSEGDPVIVSWGYQIVAGMKKIPVEMK